MPERTTSRSAGGSVESQKKARLREAVYELLARILPVIREGGSIPLRSIVEAVAGEHIGDEIWRALDAREMLTFEPGKGAKSRFTNVGRAMTLQLKAIKLKIPQQLSGWAEVLAGDQGVVLHFDKGRSISACKALFCVGVESVEITRKRIFVDMEGRSFDRAFDLGGGPEPKAPAREAPGHEEPASERKPAVPEVQKAERPIAGAATRFGGVKTALRKAARDAKANINAGIGRTRRSAAASGAAAKEAAAKAAQDAKSNVQRGVRQTRASAGQSKKAAHESGRSARASAHEQLAHVGQPVSPVLQGGKPKTRRTGGGHLGLTAYPVKLPEPLAREHHAGGGLLVLRVEPHSPADEAGLLLGDTLLTLDGSPMHRPSDLKARLSPIREGQRLDAKVLRAGKTMDVTVGFGPPH